MSKKHSERNRRNHWRGRNENRPHEDFKWRAEEATDELDETLESNMQVALEWCVDYFFNCLRKDDVSLFPDIESRNNPYYLNGRLTDILKDWKKADKKNGGWNPKYLTHILVNHFMDFVPDRYERLGIALLYADELYQDAIKAAKKWSLDNA